MLRLPGAQNPELTLVVAFAITAVLNYAFALVAGRLMSPGDYGVLAFGQTLLLLAGLILNTGVTWALARSVATRGQAVKRRLIKGGLVANCTLAALLVAAVAVGYAAGPLRRGLESDTVAAIVLSAIPLMALVAAARATAQGNRRFDRVAQLQFLEIVPKTAGGLLLAAVGFGAAGALMGFVVGGCAAAAGGALYLRSAVKSRRSVGVSVPAISQMAPLFLAVFGLILLVNTDVLAVKLLIPAREAAGYYQAAVVLANAPYFLVSSAVVPVLFTRAAAKARGDDPPSELLARALRQVLVFAVPVELALAIAPEAMLSLFFPPQYGAGAEALRILALGNVPLLFVAVLAAFAQAIGLARPIAVGLLLTVTAEAVALAVLVPHGGIVAAASVFAVAAAAGVVIAGIRVAFSLQSISIGTAWLLRYGAALAIGAIPALGVLDRSGSVPAAIATAMSAYAAGLIVFGVLRPRPARQSAPQP